MSLKEVGYKYKHYDVSGINFWGHLSFFEFPLGLALLLSGVDALRLINTKKLNSSLKKALKIRKLDYENKGLEAIQSLF